MARGSTGDLFLTIGGDVTPLRSAVKAGKSILNEFGSAAIDIQNEVDRAFANMATNAPTEAKRIEQSFSSTFAEIRRNAKAALNAPSGSSAIQIFDVAGANEAAAAAEAEAVALRSAANAAIAADKAAGGTNAAVRILAVASQTAAVEAQQHATALRSQAQALQLVTGQTAPAVASNRNLANSMGGARIAQLELQHVVTASADAYAAGASPLRILTMEMGRVAEAATFLGGTGGTGVLGKLGTFFGSGWGIALSFAVIVLTPLISKLFEGADGAKKFADAEATLTAYVKGERVAEDALLETLTKLNDQESKSLDLKNEAIRRTIDLTKATLDHAQANRTLLQTQLGTAKSDLADAQGRARTAVGRGQLELAAGQVSAAQGRVEALEKSLGTIDQVIGQATAVISTDLVKLARDLSTHVGQANDAFDKKQTDLEAKFRGTPTFSVNAKGQTVETLHGGLLNQSGLNDAKRQDLLNQLTKAEHDLNVEREKAVATASELDKAEKGTTESLKDVVSHFKSAVIGAEGTGPNRLGSSAAGFGQFMPATFLSYFNRLFPDKSQLSDAAKLGFRNVREVANAVIDKATDDYVEVLKKAGVGITQANLYAVHLLGASDAKKLLTAGAGAATSSFLSAAVLKGNPFLRGTAASARSAIATRIGDSSSAVSSGAAAIDQALKDQRQKELEQQGAFDSERNRLNEQYLSALGQVALNYQDQAASELRQIEAERQAEAAKIATNLAEGKYGEATSELAKTRAAELTRANDTAAAQRAAVVSIRKFTQQQDEIRKTVDQDYDLRLQGLHFQEDMARSSRERLAIERQIIDAEYEHRKNVLDIARKSAVEAQNWDEVARIDKDLGNLPVEKARANAQATKNNASPFDDFTNKLPHSLDEVKDRLDDIKVTAVKALEDSLASATTKALHLKGALGDVVGLVLRLAFETALGALFPKAPGGARAGGGPVDSSRWYLVGENGPEIFVPSGSGQIVPNHALSSKSPAPMSLKAANDGAHITQIYQTISPNFAGNAATQDDVVRMAVLARDAAVQAVREERRRSR